MMEKTFEELADIQFKLLQKKYPAMALDLAGHYRLVAVAEKWAHEQLDETLN